MRVSDHKPWQVKPTKHSKYCKLHNCPMKRKKSDCTMYKMWYRFICAKNKVYAKCGSHKIKIKHRYIHDVDAIE